MLLRLQLLLALAILSGTATAQSTWWVDAAGSPPGSGTFSDPFVKIQVALAAASTVDGDRIQVRPGVYLESDIDFLGKEVEVVSTDGPLRTIVDAQRESSCFVFRTAEGPGARLEGMTLRNGSGIPFPVRAAVRVAGGGLFIQDASPTIVGCRILEHDLDTEVGGGVFLYNSNARLVDCEILANTAELGGGAAMILGAPRFEGCRFEQNGRTGTGVTPFEGGGVLSISSAPVFEDSAFIDNTAGNGGGLMGPAHLEECHFEGNIGQFGGGVRGEGSETVLEECTLIGNYGLGYKGEDGFGGGAYLCVLEECVLEDNVASSGGGAHSCNLSACWIANNRVLEFDGAAEAGRGAGATNSDLTRCVLAHNVAEDPPFGAGMGGGLYNDAAHGPAHVALSVFYGNEASVGAAAVRADLDRCTVADNEPAAGEAALHDCSVESSIVCRQAGSLSGASTAQYSNIEGGSAGIGNVDRDPRFVDPGGFDYHLLLDSPSIDAGSPFAPLEADGTRADMGALPSADCNSNGRLDAVDLANQVSADQNGNGFPDECECKAQTVCTSQPNSTGAAAAIGLAGSVGIAANDMVLLASGCPANRSGLFFYGPRAAMAPFGDGLRCVAGQLFRLPVVNTGPQGVALFAVDNQMPPLVAGQLRSGAVWFFQFYYRDPAGPGGTGVNLTDALRIRFCD